MRHFVGKELELSVLEFIKPGKIFMRSQYYGKILLL